LVFDLDSCSLLFISQPEQDRHASARPGHAYVGPDDARYHANTATMTVERHKIAPQGP
jgi:hypothetical protein